MTDERLAALATIKNALQRLDRHVLERSLQPGIPAAAVQEALDEVGLVAPPELVSLYGWKDGTSTAGVAAVDDIHFFPGFYLLSVEDAVASYRAFVDDSRWRAGWLPLFANASLPNRRV
jgi:cell wall assembly regulator SMI1